MGFQGGRVMRKGGKDKGMKGKGARREERKEGERKKGRGKGRQRGRENSLLRPRLQHGSLSLPFLRVAMLPGWLLCNGLQIMKCL